ncbi:MAG: hypothetical protein COA96_12000 [SAR86 cluster bacterium]|uniref:Transmembrane anchor protein n=1 Tax=SAR86 cluster bacterium TaxID=2030880 RepID=A0A2A5AVP9_9GAMM|nr:MAG: hypothetical protein COA96_12000 [SAR86 cluster bacterium]
MSEENLAVQSTGTLVKALLVAVVLATVIFVSFVLPAEYNIDPTGIGKFLGLTILANSQEQASGIPDLSDDPDYREDQTMVLIPANSGLEYKFSLQQYGKLIYEWSSGDNDLYFDLHGEPQGDTTGYFESFASANNNAMKGSITAPFAGSHGWYWRNGSDEDVYVHLKTEGNYEIIGLK